MPSIPDLPHDDLTAAILEVALDSIVGTDRQGTVIIWNPAAEQTFGYTVSEALGRTLNDLIIPPEYREAHQRGLERYLQTGEAHVLGRRVELTALRKDGTSFPCELSIHAIHQGAEVYFTAYLRDLTERKTAEQAIAQLTSELEHRVELRTQQLLEARTYAETLVALSDALQSTEHHQVIGERTLQLLGPVLGARLMTFQLLDQDTLHIISLWGTFPDAPGTYLGLHEYRVEDAPLHWRAVRTGQPVYLDDYGHDPEALPAIRDLAFGAQPIQALSGQVKGCLVAWRENTRPWTEGERTLMQRAAVTLGIALERAEAAKNLEAHRVALHSANE